MDAHVSKPVLAAANSESPKPSREEALAAVRTLIAWSGDNPDREGLRDTPKRVGKQGPQNETAATGAAVAKQDVEKISPDSSGSRCGVPWRC